MTVQRVNYICLAIQIRSKREWLLIHAYCGGLFMCESSRREKTYDTAYTLSNRLTGTWYETGPGLVSNRITITNVNSCMRGKIMLCMHIWRWHNFMGNLFLSKRHIHGLLASLNCGHILSSRHNMDCWAVELKSMGCAYSSHLWSWRASTQQCTVRTHSSPPVLQFFAE